MKILTAHEAPISILTDVRARTDYDYCLVHLLDKYPEYKSFFKTKPFGREVLLDNGIFELGKAFDTKEFAKAVEDLKPNYYIVPDVLENTPETVTNFRLWKKEYNNLPGLKIGAIQGISYNDIRFCYQAICEQADYIAISFDFTYYEWTGLGLSKLERWCSGRQRLIQNLIDDGTWNWEKPHHLLGASLPQEFKYYVDNNIYNIRSVDTSNPVMAGIKGMEYNGNLGLQTKPEGKLADHIEAKVDETQMELIEQNIFNFKKIIGRV